jgi:serine/threonine protein kinase
MSPPAPTTLDGAVYLVSGTDEERTYLPPGRTAVGRSPANQLVLGQDRISNHHAVFDREDLVVWLSDLGSTNGTYVNGIAVGRNESVPLKPNDLIEFARCASFTIRGCSAEPSSALQTHVTVAVSPDDPPLPDTRPAAGLSEFAEYGIGRSAAETLAKRYRPLQVISRGGMGMVILVQDLHSGRFAALKVMLERAMRKEALIQQFVREAIITARLQHPNIIPVYDLGFLDAKHLYYTMRFIDGTSLHQHLRTVELAERLRLLRAAALAVAHAHALGLWHRDLKPQNILVGSLGDTYVVDWGLVSVRKGRDYKLELPKLIIERLDAVQPDRLLEQTPDAITSIDSTFALIGTPAYMAPEQVRTNGDVGAHSDVWAFGVMLYEALTGKHPILERGNHVATILNTVLHAELPPPACLDSSVPAVLSDLCMRMLVRDVAGRMADLTEFIAGVTKFLRAGSHDTSLGVPPVGPSPPPPVSTDNGAALTLQLECDRLRAKNELLTELVQLNWFEFRRKKELWRQLLRM